MPKIGDPSIALKDPILHITLHSAELQKFELAIEASPLVRGRVEMHGRKGQALHQFDRLTVLGGRVPHLLLQYLL
jgi:hypothetical protein